MDEIYNEYSKFVYKYLLALTNNKDLSEELMQETFYSAIKNIKTFKNDSNIKTWLCKIAKNKWIDYLKRNHKYKNIDIYEISEFYFNNESFEDSYIDKDNLLNLYKKIFSLDDNSKNVVLLRVKSDFSFKEIGKILGKSESWARTTYYRAKLKLKEMIDNEEK